MKIICSFDDTLVPRQACELLEEINVSSRRVVMSVHRERLKFSDNSLRHICLQRALDLTLDGSKQIGHAKCLLSPQNPRHLLQAAAAEIGGEHDHRPLHNIAGKRPGVEPQPSTGALILPPSRRR